VSAALIADEQAQPLRWEGISKGSPMIKSAAFAFGLTALAALSSCTKSPPLNLPPGTPPDPGEAGKQTLKGIDSDDDGVRDDIQLWILDRYPNEPAKQEAQFQNARTLQLDMEESISKDQTVQNIREGMRAIGCIIENFGRDQAGEETNRLRAKFLNTRARSEAYLKADREAFTVKWPTFTDHDGPDCDH